MIAEKGADLIKGEPEDLFKTRADRVLRAHQSCACQLRSAMTAMSSSSGQRSRGLAGST
jgi:hypothetical protein